MYKPSLELKRIRPRQKARRRAKALEAFFEGLITLMVFASFAIWALTVHWLALP